MPLTDRNSDVSEDRKEDTICPNLTTLGANGSTRQFAFSRDYHDAHPSPWKAAFPDRPPMGYTLIFGTRCAEINNRSEGVIDEETAKQVWLSILGEYEEFQRKGIWIPEGLIEEHRSVAKALGWLRE